MSFHFVRLLSVYPRFSISFLLLSRTWSRCTGTRIFAIVDDEPKRKEAFKDRSQGWYQPDLRENPIMRTKHFHLRLINLFPWSYLQGTFIDDITNLYSLRYDIPRRLTQFLILLLFLLLFSICISTNVSLSSNVLFVKSIHKLKLNTKTPSN